MGDLRRIRGHVDIGISEEALGSDDPGTLIEFDLSADSEVVRQDIDVAALDDLVLGVMENHGSEDTRMDQAMAIPLHRLLRITRREASDRRLWAWLGMICYPHFVAWRWPRAGSSNLRSAERFNGGRVRHTFARLWWAAELTVNSEGSYDLTESLFNLNGFQDIYEAVFGRAFSAYRPAVSSFISVVGSLPERVVREVAKEFGYLMTTMLLEAMREDEIAAVLADLARQVETRMA